ncbi:MAG TPA: DNA replication and repair protein RecF, partial [Chitinophagales bacterium]|nr:DNA replication and repair protein RecF [Chitinophagales bacterium]
MLDAIYYTCFTKSYLSSSDILNVRFTTEFFRIETHLDVNNTPHLVEVKYSKNEKKEILLDKSKLEKLADYIGKFPCVIITPDDSQLILGSSELRRKFLDASLSQYSSEYFQQLLLYNKILAQRNALLKSFYENRFFDKNLLDVYNQQLISSGNIIYTYRKDFIQQFNQIFCLFYHQIFEGNEEVSVQYTSDLHLKNFDSVLEDSISHDRNAQRTTKGIHTDDLVFELNHLPIRKIGSQGQQKTFLLSLK